MEALEEVKDAAKTFSERLSDPLLASTIVPWLVGNWRFLVVLLHDGPDETHEALIDAARTQLSISRSLVVPVAVGLFYSVVYPWIGGRIRVHRAKILATAQKDAELARRRVARELKRDQLREAVMTRDEWLSQPEMRSLRDTTNERRAKARFRYVAAAPQSTGKRDMAVLDDVRPDSDGVRSSNTGCEGRAVERPAVRRRRACVRLPSPPKIEPGLRSGVLSLLMRASFDTSEVLT